MDPVGRGSTQAGMILGLIDTILSSLGVLVVLVLMLGFGVAICSVVGTGG